MFLTVFAASALAHILFTNPTKEVDLSDIKKSLRNLDDGLNQITNTMDRHHSEVVNQLASISDTTAFLKARMCLQDFNPKLLGTPKIGPKCHSVEAIMAAATEGFTLLMDVAVASDNGYPEAQQRFDETYGNYKWVSDHFGDELNAYQQYLDHKTEIQRWVAQRRNKVNEIETRMHSLWAELAAHTNCLYRLVDSWTYYKNRFLLKWKCKKIATDIFNTQTEIRKCLGKCGRNIIYIPEYKNLIQIVKCTDDIELIKCCKPSWKAEWDRWDYWAVSEPNGMYTLATGEHISAVQMPTTYLEKTLGAQIQSQIPCPDLPIDSNWRTYHWVEPCNLQTEYPRISTKTTRKQRKKYKENAFRTLLEYSIMNRYYLLERTMGYIK